MGNEHPAELLEIKELRRRVFSLEQQLERQRTVSSRLSGGSLLESEPIDLYPGEQLDFLLELLQQAQKKCEPGSRPYDIIESLLSVNSPIGKSNEILDRLNCVFQKGYPSTEADLNELRDIGFSFTSSRKHPKLRFHEKYVYVLPATPSDKCRGHLNAFSDISKCIATRFKI